jgi:hypothetical protein
MESMRDQPINGSSSLERLRYAAFDVFYKDGVMRPGNKYVSVDKANTFRELVVAINFVANQNNVSDVDRLFLDKVIAAAAGR